MLSWQFSYLRVQNIRDRTMGQRNLSHYLRQWRGKHSGDWTGTEMDREYTNGTYNGYDDGTSNGTTCWAEARFPMVPQKGCSVVAVVELISTVLTVGLACTIRRRVETGHPVYAVLYQNSVVLAALQLLCISSLGVVCAIFQLGLGDCSLLSLWMVGESLLVSAAAIINAVSWLVVNALRYYFIVRLKPEDNPNFEQIRRRSVAAVWILLVLHTFLCFSIGLASMRLHGFPERKFVTMSPLDQSAISLVFVLVFSLTDLASVGIYLLIRRHLRTTEAEESSGNSNDQEEDPPFGGIYVGENPEEYQQENGNDNQAPASASEDESKEMRAVMLALKSYAFSCLLDTLVVVVPRLLTPTDSSYKMAVQTSTRQILFMWLPVALMAFNFEPLRAASARAWNLLRRAAAAIAATATAVATAVALTVSCGGGGVQVGPEP